MINYITQPYPQSVMSHLWLPYSSLLHLPYLLYYLRYLMSYLIHSFLSLTHTYPIPYLYHTVCLCLSSISLLCFFHMAVISHACLFITSLAPIMLHLYYHSFFLLAFLISYSTFLSSVVLMSISCLNYFQK